MTKKEITEIKESLLLRASENILQDFGLDFRNEKLKDLNSALINSAKDSGYKNYNHFAELLIEKKLNEDELDLLLKNLTVGETYFFRDEKLFNALQSEQIKEVFKNKNYVSILSAGCASGEEPYSIAILIDKFFNNSIKTQFKIYAGDINKHSLEKAKKGFYREWSFRSTPDWVKTEYFNKRENGFFEIKDLIKNKVEYSFINLSDSEKFKNDFKVYDIIICRNVLIYFSKPVVKNLINNFHQKLNSEGIYITTASESVNIDKNLFSKFINGNNAIFIKRDENFQPPEKIEKPKRNILKKDTSIKKAAPLKTVIRTEPKKKELNVNSDLKSNYENAVQKFYKKEYSQSLKLFEKISDELNSSKQKLEDKAELYFYLIKNNIVLGKITEADSLCNEFLQKEKLDYRLHYLHGILLQENGDFSEAEKAFNKSIYLNNKFPLSFFALADLQLSSGNNSYKKNFQKAAKLLLEFGADEIIKYSENETSANFLSKIARHLD